MHVPHERFLVPPHAGMLVESKLVEDLGLTEAELPAGYQLPAAK